MGLFGDIAQSIIGPIEANQDRQAAQGQANAQQMLSEKNIAMQKEFAQNGIQWRVADAEKAGLSPLAAVGAAEPGYSPVMSVFPNLPSRGWTESAHAMGQALDRATAAGESQADRDIRAANVRIAKGNADLVETQARAAKWRLLKDQTAPANPAIPDLPSTVQKFRAPDGTIVEMPSSEYSQASHGTIGKNWAWGVGDIWDKLDQLKTNLVDHPLASFWDWGKEK